MEEQKKTYDRRTILEVKWGLSSALFKALMDHNLSKDKKWLDGFKATMNASNKVVERLLRSSE